MINLTWEHVNSYRLRQHHLTERASRAQLGAVAERLVGIHAQVMSAAELQLAARVNDITPADVQAALWEERTLGKTWALRGTLHLLAAHEYPTIITALDNSVSAFYRKPSWLKYHGVTLEELDGIIDAARTILTATPLTREQLANVIATQTGNSHLKELLLSGWGALLKPVSHRGYICFGPNQEQNVTFVSP